MDDHELLVFVLSCHDYSQVAHYRSGSIRPSAILAQRLLSKSQRSTVINKIEVKYFWQVVALHRNSDSECGTLRHKDRPIVCLLPHAINMTTGPLGRLPIRGQWKDTRH